MLKFTKLVTNHLHFFWFLIYELVVKKHTKFENDLKTVCMLVKADKKKYSSFKTISLKNKQLSFAVFRIYFFIKYNNYLVTLVSTQV